MKEEVMRFRCTKEFKKQIEKEAKENNMTVSQYAIMKLSVKDVTELPELDNSEYTESSSISFSMPELKGTELYICGDCYPLFAKNERLTDTFLDSLIEHYIQETPDFSCVLYSDVERENETILYFSKDSILIEQNGFKKTYPISFQKFCECFFENIRKYSLYWAAPTNYRAWFFASFDDFNKKAERYRQAGDAIAAKLP